MGIELTDVGGVCRLFEAFGVVKGPVGVAVAEGVGNGDWGRLVTWKVTGSDRREKFAASVTLTETVKVPFIQVVYCKNDPIAQ